MMLICIYCGLTPRNIIATLGVPVANPNSFGTDIQEHCLGLFKNLRGRHYFTRRVPRMSDPIVVTDFVPGTMEVTGTGKSIRFEESEPLESPPERERVGLGFAQESQQFPVNMQAVVDEETLGRMQAAQAAPKKRRRSPAQTRLLACDIQRILHVLHNLENQVEDIYYVLQELGVHKRACVGDESMSDEGEDF